MLFPVKMPRKFSAFGSCAVTVGIREIPQEIWERLLERHINGDWGDLDDTSKATNDRAFKEGKTHWMYSVYKNAYKGKDICIETNGYKLPREVMDLKNYKVADYNHTVIMFPSER
tara:strand:+ start:3677 stop:4021 length:345 start_codon:yes stop_codon:yes gene_type:complete